MRAGACGMWAAQAQQRGREGGAAVDDGPTSQQPVHSITLSARAARFADRHADAFVVCRVCRDAGGIAPGARVLTGQLHRIGD